jgi:hypothetical protein
MRPFNTVVIEGSVGRGGFASRYCRIRVAEAATYLAECTRCDSLMLSKSRAEICDI